MAGGTLPAALGVKSFAAALTAPAGLSADLGRHNAAVVYDQVSRIVVTPLAGMARVGGVVFPKQLQQFDAIAYWNGPDGKSGTDDDIEIGRIKPKWSLEEYGVTNDDDDVMLLFGPIETGEVGDGGFRVHGGFPGWGFGGAWGSPGLGFRP